MIEHVLEELKTQPFKYFEQDKIMTLEQVHVYRGLYWDTYKYKVSFPDTVNYIYLKVNTEVENYAGATKRSDFQQQVMDSYTNLQRLYEGFRPFSGYSVIKPIACFPEWLTLVTEESPGTDVWSIIREKAKFYPSATDVKELENICQSCGKWLTLFQQITRTPEQDPYDLSTIIELFDSYLSKLVNHPNGMFPGEYQEQVIDFCRQLVLSIPDDDRVVSGIHGDFAPVNILIQNGEITVLDLETPKYGLMYWDSTYFHYHLSTLLEIPIYRPATVAKLQQAFVHGFGTPLDPSKPAVTLCMIHNVIQSLLYLAEHRQNVNWYRKLYDSILYRKHIQWLQNTCRF